MTGHRAILKNSGRVWVKSQSNIAYQVMPKDIVSRGQYPQRSQLPVINLGIDEDWGPQLPNTSDTSDYCQEGG